MDNKKAAQLLVSLYADYRTGYGKKEEYAEAVATAAMAMGGGLLRLAATPGGVTGD